MRRTLDLVVTTPDRVLVEAHDVVAVRAEDESGAFGVLPGHTDLLTVLTPSVVRWRDTAGADHFCAVFGGVLTVDDGARVAIACRQGDRDDDLAALEARIRERRNAETDADRRARVAETRLHALAVRRLLRGLSDGAPPPATADAALADTGGAP